MRTIDPQFINQVIELLDLPSNAKVTFGQFEGIASFSELCFIELIKRIFYFIFLSRQDHAEPQLQKEILEKLDFSSLKSKLVGVNVSASIQRILRYI